MVEQQYTIEAGLAIRGSIKNQVLTWCAKNHMKCATTESKSLLSSLYIFTLTGTSEQHAMFRHFLERLQQWTEEN